MTKKAANEARPDRVLIAVKTFIYLTATLLGIIGLFLLSAAWSTRNSNDWWLRWRDPLLGLNNRSMLVLGGVLHLAVSALLFVTRNLANRTLAVLWMGLNHFIYYAGVLLLEPNARGGAEQFLGWRLRISPPTVDLRWKLFQVYLIVASTVFLFLLWRRSRRMGNEAWFKSWKESRNLPKAKAAVSKQPESPETHTKILCSACGGKISFPLSRLGENVACPHCAAMITLRHSS